MKRWKQYQQLNIYIWKLSMVERVTTRFPLLLNFARPGITHCVTKSWVLNLFLSHMILLFILERKILCIVPACAWQLSSRTLHLDVHTAYLNSDRKYSASSGLEMFLGIFPNRTISQEISKSHKLLMAFWSHIFTSFFFFHLEWPKIGDTRLLTKSQHISK